MNPLEDDIPGTRLSSPTGDVKTAEILQDEEDEGVGEEGEQEEVEREETEMSEEQQDLHETDDSGLQEQSDLQEDEKNYEAEENLSVREDQEYAPEENEIETHKRDPEVESDQQVDEGLVIGEGEGHDTEGQVGPDRWVREEEDVENGEAEDEAADEVVDEPAEDENVERLVASGDLEQMAAMVLSGQGDRLQGFTSDDPDVQTFLNNVPAYIVNNRRAIISKKK